MAEIDNIPEHLERVLIRPLVENFCYNFMYKHKYESFIVKLVEYCPKENVGKADVYFSTSDGEYQHLFLKIPIIKKTENGKMKIHVQDPVIDKKNNDNPYKKK